MGSNEEFFISKRIKGCNKNNNGSRFIDNFIISFSHGNPA